MPASSSPFPLLSSANSVVKSFRSSHPTRVQYPYARKRLALTRLTLRPSAVPRHCSHLLRALLPLFLPPRASSILRRLPSPRRPAPNPFSRRSRRQLLSNHRCPPHHSPRKRDTFLATNCTAHSRQISALYYRRSFLGTAFSPPFATRLLPRQTLSITRNSPPHLNVVAEL